ncbi:hypothetical protein F53441_4534 [Fusarium austroafricanum]|uniref:Chromo domain-containing protein n=1 Tax=Fusarium austroafricanum TaxID=2364996 RepID=A0A8H4KMQ3_9HYPO|nr:hypothetical protein F53441_4534 [Fusarium austroafricanum]
MVTRKEKAQPTTRIPRTSLNRKPKRKRQEPDSEPELVEQSPAPKRRKSGAPKVWWAVRRVIGEQEHRLDPKDRKIKHQCLVQWEPSSKGETYEDEWIDYKDINAAALEDWEKEKETKEREEREKAEREVRRREKRNRRGLRDITPRKVKIELPEASNRQQLQRLNTPTQSRSRSDSLNQDVQPRRSPRVEPEGAFSEEPVPSIVSASSWDAESLSSSGSPVAPAQQVVVVLGKPDNFDPSEYQSVNTQNSSQRITDLEDDDQRVAFASQLSQDTIPDSQDQSGHWELEALESQSASRPERITSSPEVPRSKPSAATGYFGIDRRVEEIASREEAQSSEYATSHLEVEALRSSDASADFDLGFSDFDHSDDQNLDTDDIEVDSAANCQTFEDSNLDSNKYNHTVTGSIRDIDSPEHQSFETANSQATQSPLDSPNSPITQDQRNQDSISVVQRSGEGQQVVEDHAPEPRSEENALGEEDLGADWSASSHQSRSDQNQRADQPRQSEKSDPLSQSSDIQHCVNAPEANSSLKSPSATKELSQSQEPPSSHKEVGAVVPDSQDCSSTSTKLTTSGVGTLAASSRAQVTPVLSQVEIVPDSAATGSNIPSRQLDQPHLVSTQIRPVFASSLSSEQDARGVVGETTTPTETSPVPNNTQNPVVFYSQPQGLHDSLDISSSVSSGAEALREVVKTVSDIGSHARATGEPWVSQEDSEESQATQLVSQPCESQPERNIFSQGTASSNKSQSALHLDNIDSGPEPLLPNQSQIDSASEPPFELPRLSSAIPEMDRSVSQPQSSAVDELKSFIDFGKDSLLNQFGESIGENPDGTSDEAPIDQEPVAGASTADLDVVASSPESAIRSQPVYSVDPWKPEALGNTPEAPVPSISPASIMANPHISAVDSMREVIDMTFGDSEDSITRSLLSQDVEDTMPPGTISPAAISRSIDPVVSTHTLNFPSQDIVPAEVESSGHSIVMGQVPVDQDSDASSQSSQQDDICLQCIVTLPMQASRRPYYGEIIKDHKAEIQAFSRFFTGETPESPTEALVQKINSLFDRLFNICDYPQDVIGSDLETQPSSELAKYCCDANTKFSFLFELMSALDAKERGILIVVRSRELMRLIFALAQAAKIECSAESISKRTNFPSITRITLALATEEFDPFNFDIIVGYDFHYLGSSIAKQLRDNSVRKSPLVLLLVTTHSIEHVRIHSLMERLHSLVDASELEIKNAVLAYTVSAGRYLEDPERGYGEPHEVAEMFANYLNDITDTLNWEPQGIPDDVLDIFENPMSQTQLLFAMDSLHGNGLKRKHNDDEDVDAKRMRKNLALRDLPINSNNPPMPRDVRQMLDKFLSRGGVREREAMVTVPLATLQSIAEYIDEYKRQTSQAGEVEAELKSHIDRLDKELKDHLRTLNKIELSNRAALQDRTMFEKEKLRIEATAQLATEVAQKEKEKQQQRINDLESTIARLNENPESAKREEALSEAKKQLQVSEGKLKNALSDVDFMKSRYQDVDSQALRLTNENKLLKAQNEELRQKASENLLAVHSRNTNGQVQELQQQITALRAQVEQRDAELLVAQQKLSSFANGRNTRGGSMPRSPRVPIMSPRPGRTAFSASRGTSPTGPGQQFMGQQAGNARWKAL